MIKKPTVFVLGAGASRHLDYPTAQGLRSRILELMNAPNENIWQDFDPDTLNKFRTSFQSSVPSIDAFLELHPEFDSLGKRAIARALIPLESDNNLWRHIQSNASKNGWANWYEYLFTLLRSGVKKPDEFWLNKFYVITFNYDRSLEHYLARCLNSSYGIEYAEAVLHLSERVFHVHGMLSPLGVSEGAREYRLDLDSEIVSKAARSIKVVHEPELYGVGLLARQKLLEAKRVYFLGFGYDRANLAKLIWPSTFRGQAWGTSIGMEQGEIEAIKAGFKIEFPDGSALGIESLLRNSLPSSVDH